MYTKETYYTVTGAFLQEAIKHNAPSEELYQQCAQNATDFLRVVSVAYCALFEQEPIGLPGVGTHENYEKP